MTETNYNKFRDSLARLQERYKDYENHKELESHVFSVLRYVLTLLGSILKNI